MIDDSLDFAGSSEDAGATFMSADTESVPEESFYEESETEGEKSLEGEGFIEGEGSTTNEESVIADSEGSIEESDGNAVADTYFRVESVDDTISYVSVPSGYEVMSVSNIPDYTNAFIAVIFGIGSLLGFLFARVASWR